MPINKELLAKVRDHILAEPRRYDQLYVGTSSTDAPCGTAACIYGWAAVLGGITTEEGVRKCGRQAKEHIFEFEEVSKLFGFDDDEETIVSEYRGRHWPKEFGEALREAQAANDKEGQAKAAAAYLNWIIENGRVT